MILENSTFLIALIVGSCTVGGVLSGAVSAFFIARAGVVYTLKDHNKRLSMCEEDMEVLDKKMGKVRNTVAGYKSQEKRDVGQEARDLIARLQPVNQNALGGVSDAQPQTTLPGMP